MKRECETGAMSAKPTMFILLRNRVLRESARARIQFEHGDWFRVISQDKEQVMEDERFVAELDRTVDDDDYLMVICNEEDDAEAGVLLSRVEPNIEAVCREADWLRRYLKVRQVNREASVRLPTTTPTGNGWGTILPGGVLFHAPCLN